METEVSGGDKHNPMFLVVCYETGVPRPGQHHPVSGQARPGTVNEDAEPRSMVCRARCSVWFHPIVRRAVSPNKLKPQSASVSKPKRASV